MRVLGMEVVPSMWAERPRMTLAENVPVTPAFRASINAWMREFFGTEPMIYITDPAALGLRGNQVIIAHPSLVASLRDVSLAHNPPFREGPCLS